MDAAKIAGASKIVRIDWMPHAKRAVLAELVSDECLTECLILDGTNASARELKMMANRGNSLTEIVVSEGDITEDEARSIELEYPGISVAIMRSESEDDWEKPSD